MATNVIKFNKSAFQSLISKTNQDVLNNLGNARHYLWADFNPDGKYDFENKLQDRISNVWNYYYDEVFICLLQVRDLIDEFENFKMNLGDFLSNKNVHILDKNINLTTSEFIGGERTSDEQISVIQFEVKGKFVTLAEATNAFYTISSPTISYLIAANANIDNKEDFENYAKDFLIKSDSTFSSMLAKGYFSVAAIDDISEIYRISQGEDSHLEKIGGQYKNLVESLVSKGDKDVILTNSTTAFGMEMAAGVIAGLGGFKGLEGLPKQTTPNYSQVTPSYSQTIPSYSPSAVASTEKPLIEQPLESVSEVKDENEKLKTENDELKAEIEKLKAELESLKKEGEIAGIKERIAAMEDEVLPEKVEMDEYLSEDIDAEARDIFYSENDVSESRYETLEEFKAMNYETQIQELEKIGYSETDAKMLASDITKGGTAFVLGKENLQIADISNQIALENGIVDHETKFDNSLTYEYVNSGNANYDLGTMTSPELIKSRSELNAIRKDYSLAVDEANKVNTSLEATKQNYDSVLYSIKATSGEDPKNWTSDQIASYNQVVDNYDKSLEEFKIAQEKVTECKEKYVKAKADYNVVYEDMRNSVIRDTDISIKNETNTMPEVTIETLDEDIESKINSSIKTDGDVLIIDSSNFNLGNNGATFIDKTNVVNDIENKVEENKVFTINNDNLIINGDVKK